MATYIGSSINPSPTIVLEAGVEFENARGLAVAVSDGAAVLPEAGANAIGIAIIETDEDVAVGDDMDIQIKDIGKWVAAEAIEVGAELATDASGKAVNAASGNFIVGIALTAAEADGDWIQVQITKSGYKA